jgi:Homing endonuclease associated repeat
MAKITRETIIEAARAAAKDFEGNLSKADFMRLTRIGEHHIWRLFPGGGWTKIRELAGIGRHPNDHDVLNDDQLLAEYLRVAKEAGRIPTWSIFESRANFSCSAVTRRFGGLQGTLKRLRDYLEAHEPESELLVELQAKFKHEIPTPPAASPAHTLSKTVWAKGSGPVFGQPIDFRGLRHAPINEQGVVFLFGMVAYELGFIVESVQAGYPDCEAKRCVERKAQRWQRVRIEFEFCSSNFAQHGHEAAGCDVVVCWEHDWPECPLEVVELRSLISSLQA